MLTKHLKLKTRKKYELCKKYSCKFRTAIVRSERRLPQKSIRTFPSIPESQSIEKDKFLPTYGLFLTQVGNTRFILRARCLRPVLNVAFYMCRQSKLNYPVNHFPFHWKRCISVRKGRCCRSTLSKGSHQSLFSRS